MAFTSDMIPRMVYLYAYGEGVNMRGYINNSLSIYNISQIQKDNMPEKDYWLDNSTSTCRYSIRAERACCASGFSLVLELCSVY